MNRIFEEIKPINVLVPQAQDGGDDDTSAYVDGADCLSIDFVVTFGELAQTKKVVAELLVATAADGTGAKSVGDDAKAELKAPTGGLGDGTIILSTQVKADVGRYYAVKVSNDASAAGTVDIAAIALVRTRHSDALNDFEVTAV